MGRGAAGQLRFVPLCSQNSGSYGQSMSLVQSEASASAPAGDLALVKRLLAGDEAAVTGVVERYHGPLLRFARLFVSNAAVAEEVVQDT